MRFSHFAAALGAAFAMSGATMAIASAEPAGTPPVATEQKAGPATDLSARRRHHHMGHRHWHAPRYYARPYAYRPYGYHGGPFAGPPIGFGFNFGPRWSW